MLLKASHLCGLILVVSLEMDEGSDLYLGSASVSNLHQSKLKRTQEKDWKIE